MGKASRRKHERRKQSVAGRLEILVTLMPVELEIDRRILLRDGATLEELHYTIQAAMGWDDLHLHEFASEDGTRYRNLATSSRRAVVDESRIKTKDILRKPGDVLTYTYDFGDNWFHRIELVAIRKGQGPKSQETSCIGGRGAGPPEDCGGVTRYLHLLDVLADPNHEAHEEQRDWLIDMDRYPLDPKAFDLERTHMAVRRGYA